MNGWYVKVIGGAILGVFIAAIFTSPSISFSNEVGSSAHLAGAASSIPRSEAEAFRTPAGDLSYREILAFQRGKDLFEAPIDAWSPSSSTIVIEDHNGTSCLSCHPNGGRNAIEQNGRHKYLGLPVSILSRDDDLLGFSIPKQIQVGNRIPAQEISINWTEGTINIRDRTFDVVFPTVEVNGIVNPDLILKIPPNLNGLALIEAIEGGDIETWYHQTGIGALPVDRRSSAFKTNKFGFRATSSSVETFVEGAIQFELGVNDLQSIDPRQIEAVSYYSREIGVPVRESIDDVARSGEDLFSDIGCVACHRPSYGITRRVGSREYPMVIWPFSDFLLHDLGYGSRGFIGPSHVKTTPLWSIGRIEETLGFGAYLYDGRARNITEAIVWHGGDAAFARRSFFDLGDQERQEVIAFLESL